ncbi:MAG: J domain-containing protein [Alphaproteobacteria bacterium]|nr:J domain-containing protein [Alphaproteobacteria bacterium]
MPRIVLKPNSAEYDDGTPAEETRCCDMPGCRENAPHRAPKGRDLNDYHWFCLEHVREYNEAWNYFSGMSDREVQDQMYRSMYGDRPTWRYDVEGAAEDALRRKAWQTYNYTEKEAPKNNRNIDDKTPEGEALSIMGLQAPITLESIKARYKELVKKHHPDLNPGCAESQETLKSVNMAYTILKISYEKFKVISDK